MFEIVNRMKKETKNNNTKKSNNKWNHLEFQTVFVLLLLLLPLFIFFDSLYKTKQLPHKSPI